MSEQVIMYMMLISGGLFLAVIVAYMVLSKYINKSDAKYIKQLREGTKEKSFSMEMLYSWVRVYTPFLCFLSREDPLAFVEELVWWC